MKNEYETNEAWGLVSFHRTTGHRRLFGSSIDNQNMILLEISKCKRKHDLGQYWYCPDESITQVILSEAQFASLITTMNQGPGVPCTIRFSQETGYIEHDQKDESEIKSVSDEFKKRMKNFGENIESQLSNIEQILLKKSINKSDRIELQKVLSKNLQEIKSNIPFYLKQFEEASQNIVTQAKAETDAFVTSVIHKHGLDQMQKLKKTTERIEE